MAVKANITAESYDKASSMVPVLNWLELKKLVASYDKQCRGFFVDRVIIPSRPRFSEGFVKGEWALRLSSQKHERMLFFSVRSRHTYLVMEMASQLKNASFSTQSAFGLALSKTLPGLKVSEIEALPQERVVCLWFEAGESRGMGKRLGLVLSLIPTTPEALLVETTAGARTNWQVLARSRANLGNTENTDLYTPPDGRGAPLSPALRDELTLPQTYAELVAHELEREAFELRRTAAERTVRDMLKQARSRAAQLQTSLSEANNEADWQKLADHLKGAFGSEPQWITRQTPRGETHFRRVMDYETEQWVEIPSDPKLEPGAQLEKLYALSRRKSRRISEAKSRSETLQNTVRRLEGALSNKPLENDWETLQKLEQIAGIAPPTDQRTDAKKTERRKKAGSWLGRSFVSKDGATIWVGKTRDENLELTFKHAKGNDVWMHVKGKPGAHVLIPLTGGRSASLETLLDAGQLVVFYSGGENWGKTEVDYTFKKYVKRIKDSTEASYTNNKTLVIASDRTRLQRLLAQQDESKAPK